MSPTIGTNDTAQITLLDRTHYIALIYQYLASLTSDDPFAFHTFPLHKVNPRASNAEETIQVPPLTDLLHEHIQQVEYPNLLNPKGAVSDRSTILTRAVAAKNIITDSTFAVQSVLIGEPVSHSISSEAPENGIEEVIATAAVEALWTGTVAKDVGEKLKKGLPLKARFAMFFEFREGKIYRQTNYDCFDSF